MNSVEDLQYTRNKAYICLQHKIEYGIMQPAEEARQFYQQALAYDEAEDVYNAIKLYKRIIKLQPQWLPPYLQLRTIYKRRREWKPAYHYTKRSLSLNSTHSDVWWDLGIAATALKKWRIANNVWGKFNFPSSFPAKDREFCSLYLNRGKQFEVVLARPLCPARAEILSIPLPESRQRFRDIVLYDRRELKGYNIAGGKKLPVFNFLGHWKHSSYHTFSCELHTCREEDIRLMESLCRQAGYGFENWSNASLNFSPGIRKGVPEFYTFKERDGEPAADMQKVAIAAHNRREVERLLQQWRLISLKEHGALEQHA